jgi:hypothetical protein
MVKIAKPPGEGKVATGRAGGGWVVAPKSEIITGPLTTGWPAMHPNLFPYQREGVEWLRGKRFGLLGDDMGLGKSLQLLHRIRLDQPAIVFCPVGAKAVWERELKHWFPDRSLEIVKVLRWPKPGEILVANLDKLWPLKKEGGKGSTEFLEESLRNISPETLLIVDECHLLKGKPGRQEGQGTRRVRRWRHAMRAAKGCGGQVIGATGTPVLNAKGELYNLLISLGCDDLVFPNGFIEAKELLRMDDKWGDPSPVVKQRLKKVMLRRTKEEVYPQMPQIIRDYRGVNVPKKLGEDMDSLWSRLSQFRLDTMEEFWSALHAVGGLEVFSKIKAALASAKIPELIETVEEFEAADVPLIVCSAHLAPVEAIGSREGWDIITGETSGKKRGQIEDDFREGRLRGVALTIKAGGVGISLTRASNMVINDLEWSPEIMSQCEMRMRPHLQKRACQVVYLKSKHQLEHHMYWLLEQKRELIGKLI